MIQQYQSQSNRTAHVFTYGSLMYPEIFEQVTGALPQSVLATAHHWRRHSLAGRTYPGALPDSTGQSTIEGVLWLNVSSLAISALDRFEGQEYRRVGIEVTTSDGDKFQANIYQWLLPSQILWDAWCKEDFEQNHRQNFVQTHGVSQDSKTR